MTPSIFLPDNCNFLSRKTCISRCLHRLQEGWREAMIGTIALYNKAGERLHTIYLGAAPEYGKASFLERLEQEVYHIKLQYPEATYVGMADGVRVKWDLLV